MSLHQYKDPASILAEIRMTRTLGERPILIVEGSEDARFWSGRVRDPGSTIVAGGRPTLLGALRRVDSSAVRGVLAVADADYDRLLSNVPTSPNLVLTDEHDLETTLASIGALRRVLFEYGDSARIATYESVAGVPAVDALIDLAADIGRFRWLNLRLPVQVPMKWLVIAKYIEGSTLKIDAVRLRQDAVTNGLAANGPTLLAKLAELPVASPWQVARGHDLVELTYIALKSVFSGPRAIRGVDEVAGALRLAADSQRLEATAMLCGMRSWEKANPTYEVLQRTVG